MMMYTSQDCDCESQTFTFLDNHNVTRFGFVQRNQRPYNAALAALLMSRGTPNLYYGTKQYVLSDDTSDIFVRVFMQTDCSFDVNTTAYKLTAKLSQLRQENDAFAFGETNILYSNTDVMMFERKFYYDVVVVVVNRQPDKSTTLPKISTNLPNGTYGNCLNGLLFGESTNVQGGVKYQLLHWVVAKCVYGTEMQLRQSRLKLAM